jgi:Insect cuticle protein.
VNDTFFFFFTKCDIRLFSPQSITPPRYRYVYEVKDPKGNDFGHSEARQNGRTWGHYFVQLPDGRQKTVRYWADSTGFHAKVEYEGHALAEEE